MFAEAFDDLAEEASSRRQQQRSSDGEVVRQRMRYSRVFWLGGDQVRRSQRRDGGAETSRQQGLLGR